MRKTLMLIGIPVAAVGVAVGVAVAIHSRGTKPQDKFTEDLRTAQAAGLDLAQAQSSKKYALTEIAPSPKPAPSKAIREGDGPDAVKPKNPTVNAAPEQTAAVVVEELPEVQIIQTSAAPEAATATAPAVPRPVPQTTSYPESDQGPILAGGTGRGSRGTGGDAGPQSGTGGTIIGTILGAIIRGGTVDGDNCDPRSTRGGHPASPVYGQNPSGMGTGRIRPGMPVSSSPMGPSGGTITRPRG